jgi:type IV pilus assembly protein PilE
MKRVIRTTSKNRGMTLLELLIVVVIFVFLASVTLPLWNSQVQKARRADAKNLLLFVQIEQERYRADTGSYAPSMSALGFSGYNSTSRDYYNISILSSNENTFVATATPDTNGGQDDDLCGTFAVDQAGPNESGSYASISDCW